MDLFDRDELDEIRNRERLDWPENVFGEEIPGGDDDDADDVIVEPTDGMDAEKPVDDEDEI